MNESADDSKGSAGPIDEGVPPEIIERARAGDKTAFEKVYDYYYRQIWNLIARVIISSRGTREDVEEVHQETWERAWKGICKVQGKLRFEPWIRRIAVNLSIDNIRKRKRVEFDQLPDDEAIDEQSMARWVSLAASSMKGPEELVGENEFVRLALAQLSTQFRLCLILYYVEGFSQQEIADIISQQTGRPIQSATIGGYLSRGRDRFREVYRQATIQTGDVHE